IIDKEEYSRRGVFPEWQGGKFYFWRGPVGRPSPAIARVLHQIAPIVIHVAVTGGPVTVVHGTNKGRSAAPAVTVTAILLPSTLILMARLPIHAILLLAPGPSVGLTLTLAGPLRLVLGVSLLTLAATAAPAAAKATAVFWLWRVS